MGMAAAVAARATRATRATTIPPVPTRSCWRSPSGWPSSSWSSNSSAASSRGAWRWSPMRCTCSRTPPRSPRRRGPGWPDRPRRCIWRRSSCSCWRW